MFIYSSTNCARRSLYWLPVKQRIQFKNLSLTYKSLHTGLPPYLNSARVPFSSPFHSTRRSSPANLILSTMTHNSSHTSKSQLNYSFDYIATRNWNSLPDTVQRLAPSVLTFREKALKPFLLWQAFYPPQIHFSYLLALLDYDAISLYTTTLCLRLRFVVL